MSKHARSPFMLPEHAAEAAGPAPGGVSFHTGHAARDRALASGFPNAEICEMVMVCRNRGGMVCYLQTGLGASLILFLLFFTFKTIGGVQNRMYMGEWAALVFVIGVMPLFALFLILTEFRSGHMIAFSRQGIFHRRITRWRPVDTTLEWDEITGLEWLKDDKGFETHLLSRNGARLPVAQQNVGGTLWTARLFEHLTGLHITGNIPFPEPGDKRALRKIKNSSAASDPESAEIIHPNEAFWQHALNITPTDFSIIPGEESGSFTIIQNFGNWKHALFWLFVLCAELATTTDILRGPMPHLDSFSDLHSPLSGPALVRYFVSFLSLIPLVFALDAVTGKYCFTFTRDHVVRTREWCRISFRKKWCRESATHIDLFRSAGHKTTWYITLHWTKNGKKKQTDMVATATASDAFWMAAAFRKWAGVPVFERPNQRPDVD